MPDIQLPHDHGAHSHKLLAHMPQLATCETVSEAFKLLSDPRRVQIYWLLCHCEECVINLSAMMEMSSPAVSHHLKQLRMAGLVTSRREGKEVYYKAAASDQARLLHEMIEDMVKIACPDKQM